MTNYQNCIEIKYNGIIKEVSFSVKKNSREVDCPSLSQYMHKQGGFVLQQHGLEFLKNIANIFDNNSKVHIELLGTEYDYEDLEALVKKYNKLNDRTVTFELSKLNDKSLCHNDELVKSIIELGEKGSRIIDRGKKEIEVILENQRSSETSDNDNELYSIANELNNYYEKLQNQIESLKDTHVTICVVGLLNTGKSLLINSLIGNMILPVSLNEKTAKNFCIQSPKTEGDLIIQYSTNGEKNEIKLDQKKYDQMHSKLMELNNRDDVDSTINVEIDIPFDTEDIHFRFYDTPGGDSIHSSNINTLNSILKNGQETILLYLLNKDSRESRGNISILDEIKNSDKQIDIDRSIFVYNKAEDYNPDDRKFLSEVEKLGDIDMSNKNVVFTSAQEAIVSKMVMSGKIDKNDQIKLESGGTLYSFNYLYSNLKANKDTYKVYTYNKYGKNSSDYIEKEEKEYNETEDNCTRLFIASGVNALIKQFKSFAKKYSIVSKLGPIINTIKTLITSFEKRIDAIENVRQYNKKIEDERDTFSKELKRILDSYTEGKSKLEDDEKLEELKKLKIDHDSIRDSRDNFIKKFESQFGTEKIIEDQNDEFKDKVLNIIHEHFKGYVDNFNDYKKKKNWDFIEDLKKIIPEKIDNCADLSSITKSYIKKIINDIPDFKIEDFNPNISSIYKEAIIKKWLGRRLFDWLIQKVKRNKSKESEWVNIRKFIESCKGEWLKICGDFYDQLNKDYQETIKKCIDEELKDYFIRNMDSLNTLILLKTKDKELFEDVKSHLEAMNKELRDVLDIIDKKIWDDENV